MNELKKGLLTDLEAGLLADLEAMADWVDEVIKVIDDSTLPDAQKVARLKELRKLAVDS